MRHETAIGAQLAKAGIHARDVELNLAIAKFHNNGGDYDTALAMLDAAYGKGSEGQVTRAGNGQPVTAPASLTNDDGKGRPTRADEACHQLPAPSSTERAAQGHIEVAGKVTPTMLTSGATERNGAGQSAIADKAIPLAPRPVSPAYVEAAKKGAKIMAITVLDSFKVRDGRPIGDVPFSSIDRLIAEGGHEMMVLKLIRARGVPPDRNTPIRLLIGVQEMERIIQKAAEVADAA